MNAFSAAVATLFADPNGAVDGVLTDAGGPVPVRVVLEQPDPTLLAFDGPGARNPGLIAEIATSLVPSQPSEDATLTIAGTTYTTRNWRQPNDPQRLLWRGELTPL